MHIIVQKIKNTILTKDFKRNLNKNITGYGFILPFFIFSVTFALIPLLWVFKLSFQDGGIIQPAKWVGFANYITLLKNKDYLNYFLNNFVLLLMIVPFAQCIAFLLAILLKQKSRSSSVLEAIFFLPLLISMIAAGILALYVFSIEGPVNYVLSFAGINPINWLGNSFRAKVVITILETWKGATFHTFIYIAAIRAIPSDYYEVAYIEGAKFWQVLFRVTIPLIKGTILFCFTMSTIWVLQIFDSIYVTTFGGPLQSTASVVFEIYLTTFKHNHVGQGAALSIVFLLVILVISRLQMRFLKSDIEY
jgi:multiple sugar transport system permease protein